MGFSTTLFLLALAHAVVGLAMARNATTLWAAIIRASAGSAASTIATSVVWSRAAAWFDLFALAHVAYLGIVVTVPAMAAGGLLLRWRTPHPALAGRGALVSLVVALLPAVAGVYATHIEPTRLEVDRHELVLADRPDLEEPIRIGVLADLQTPRVGDHEHEAIGLLVESRPDLLLVAGDLWSGGVRGETWADFTGLIETMVDGATTVVLVEGDSDDVDRLHRLAEGTGAHVLADETLDLDIRGQAVRIGGITLREKTERPGQRATIAALEAAHPDVITVLLSHRPDAVYDLAESIDLVVAGHTHGGQVALPLFGPLLTLSDVPRSVAAGGLHRIDGQPIYVSTGVGMERSHAPQVRFGVRPSVGVIDLVGPG